VNTTTSPSSSATSSRARALVLHGGGSAGNAWEIGVVAGLFDAGLDVTKADLIVGTSAGATAAAQVTAATPAELFRAILEASSQPPSTRAAYTSARDLSRPGPNMLEITNAVIAPATDAADMRRRMGAWALGTDASSDRSAQERWRATVASRLPGEDWPDQRILITAVDARTGEGVAFDRNSGVELVDAVAASCSSGFAYSIGDERYIDGGYRRNENADLAMGYGRVLMLSPFGGRTRHPLESGMQLAAQVDELRSAGSIVETIFPDAAALAAFGGNMMDLSTRAPAAQAGYAQGITVAAQLTGFWR
jgi:NTE family protein